MGKVSTFAKNKMIDHVFKSGYTPAATLYLCLCTADPTVDGTGASIAETDYSGYVRKSFIGSDYFTAAAARKIAQNTIITFSEASGVSTSDISHWCICDAAADGNMLASGSFNTPFNVVAGNTIKISATQIEIEIEDTVDTTSGGFSTVAANFLLDHVFLNDGWASPAADIHFGLTTAVMTDASTLATITECATAQGYAREPVPATSFDAAADAANETNADIEFDAPTGSLGTITSAFVCNALSGTSGVVLCYDNKNVDDQVIGASDEVVIEAGSFSVTLN